MSALFPAHNQNVANEQLQHHQHQTCWICLEELGSNNSRREWIYPCQCSLICHEECLLHWVFESEQRIKSGEVKCPQCKTPYRVKQWHSATFTVLRKIYQLADQSVPFFMATFGSMAVVVACTAYGAYAVMTLYGPAEGRRLLSNPAGAATSRWGLDSKWFWLPVVPLTLLLSRVQPRIPYMPLSTLFVVGNPLRFAQWPMPPTLLLSVLPAISSLYQHLWNATLGRIERRWESQLPKEPETVTIRGRAMFREGAQEPQPLAADIGDPDPVGIGMMVMGEEEEEEDNNNNNNNNNDGARPNHNLEATIVLNGAALSRKLVESLLLPLISSVCGTLVGKLPQVRRLHLGHFSKVMVGGCTYFVVRDLLCMLYKYLMYRSHSSRYIQGRKRL